MGGVVCPWHFDNGASRLMMFSLKMLDSGLLHVLPLTVHLQFFIDGQVGWTILDPKITVSPFGFIGVGTGLGLGLGGSGTKGLGTRA